MKYLDLFSGVGAFGKAMTNVGIDYELVGFSEIDKWAIQSYCAIHGVDESLNLGDVSEIKEEDIPNADLITYGFPCFTGDTLIYTDKGIKQLKDVKIGEKVLTHKNNFQPVTAFFKQGKKEIWGVRTMNSHLIKTTSNHKFYIRTKGYKWDDKNKRNKRYFGKPYWKEVKNLTKDDYAGYAINNKKDDYVWSGVPYGRWNKITNNLPIKDKRLWYLAGRYIGDGWLVRRKSRNNNISRVVICTSLDEADDFENKIEGLYNYNKVKEGSIYKFHFVNKELGHFMQQFGEGAKNKHIPAEILNLSVDYLKPLSQGLMDSDGSYTGGYYKLTSISERLVYSYGQLIAKVYKKPFSIYKTKRPDKCVIEGRVVNQNDTYQLTFKNKKDKQDKAFYENGYIWFPIREVKNLEYKELVYDITVKKDHSFTVYGTIVHNCQDLSISGKQKGIAEGTKSGLLYEAERIIDYNKPKYAIAENVKNLVSKRFKDDFNELLERLDHYGYNNYWKVLNAKDYGVPQNRERVFIVSIRKDIDDGVFEFPKPKKLELTLQDMLDNEIEDKYIMDNDFIIYDQPRGNVIGEVDIKGTEQIKRIYDKNQYAPTLSTMQGGHREPKIIVGNDIKPSVAKNFEKEKENIMASSNEIYQCKVDSGWQDNKVGLKISPTLRAGNHHTSVLDSNCVIRKLTPLECWRLMGFDDGDYWKARTKLESVFYNGNDRSNSQMYKQAGNSIVVDVLEGIFVALFR